MRIFSKIILIVLLFLPGIIFAQQETRFEHITLDDGLPENSVIDVLQDYQGFLWFATQFGPVKYDGYKFTLYTGNSADTNIATPFSVYSFYEDKSNNLWMGTEFGLSRYNRNENRLENFPLEKDVSRTIYSICEDDYGYLYFGSEVSGTGLYKFNKANKSYTKFLNDPLDTNSIGSNYIYNVFKDDSSTIWIATLGGGLNKLDIKSQTFTRYQNSPGNRNSISSNNVYSIYKDRQGDLWIGTDRGLNKFDKYTKTFTLYNVLPNESFLMKDNYINSIYEDSSGYLWISVYFGGLVKFEPVTGASVEFKYEPNNQHSLRTTVIETIFEDRSGIFWLGSTGYGLYKYDRDKSRFVHFSNMIEKNHSDDVSSILDDSSGNLWIGTIHGLCRFDRKSNSFTNFDKITGVKGRLTSKGIDKLYIDRESNLWIGTSDGLNKFNTKTGRLVNYLHIEGDTCSLSHNFIWDIYEDSMGKLWIATYNGLNIFNRKHETFKVYYNIIGDSNSISGNNIVSIYEDKKGDLWFGANDDRGLNKYNREKETFRCFNRRETYTQIYEDSKGRFWTATYKTGLNLFDRNTGAITRVTEREGLVHNSVYSILEDNNGNLWVGTQNGLSRYNPETNKIKNFDKNDLPFTHFLMGCMKDKNGFMFIGGYGGFIMFHPDSIRDNAHIPEIVLTEFKIFNQPVIPKENSPLKQNINTAKEITLTYYQNMFSFEFAALDYRNPMKNQYAYKLEGFNSDWIYTDASSRTATYTDIDPGEYVFRVKGSNNDGVWNEEGTSVRIIITPPWWQTWWFRGCGILLILAALEFSRERHMKKVRREIRQKENFSRQLISGQEQERKRIASDLHDSLAQNLLVLKNRVSLLMRRSKSKEELRDISDGLLHSMDEIRSITYSLRPHEIERFGLTDSLGQIIEKVSESCSIIFKTQIENINRLLKQDDEVILYRIVQECLNNIVKHSGAKTALIKIAKLPDSINIQIKDDGRGFDPERLGQQNKHSLGMTDIRERINLLKGKFEIETSPGKGTSIQLNIPYKTFSNEQKT